MFSWKAIRALLAGPGQREQVLLDRLVLATVDKVLVLLAQARTVRQVLELQSLAVQWALAPEQRALVVQAARQALTRVPTAGTSLQKNTRSRTTRARSTTKRRRAR
jgi:prophage DNA circulation protein